MGKTHFRSVIFFCAFFGGVSAAWAGRGAMSQSWKKDFEARNTPATEEEKKENTPKCIAALEQMNGKDGCEAGHTKAANSCNLEPVESAVQDYGDKAMEAMKQNPGSSQQSCQSSVDSNSPQLQKTISDFKEKCNDGWEKKCQPQCQADAQKLAAAAQVCGKSDDAAKRRYTALKQTVDTNMKACANVDKPDKKNGYYKKVQNDIQALEDQVESTRNSLQEQCVCRFNASNESCGSAANPADALKSSLATSKKENEWDPQTDIDQSQNPQIVQPFRSAEPFSADFDGSAWSIDSQCDIEPIPANYPTTERIVGEPLAPIQPRQELITERAPMPLTQDRPQIPTAAPVTAPATAPAAAPASAPQNAATPAGTGQPQMQSQQPATQAAAASAQPMQQQAQPQQQTNPYAAKTNSNLVNGQGVPVNGGLFAETPAGDQDKVAASEEQKAKGAGSIETPVPKLKIDMPDANVAPPVAAANANQNGFGRNTRKPSSNEDPEVGSGKPTSMLKSASSSSYGGGGGHGLSFSGLSAWWKGATFGGMFGGTGNREGAGEPMKNANVDLSRFLPGQDRAPTGFAGAASARKEIHGPNVVLWNEMNGRYKSLESTLIQDP